MHTSWLQPDAESGVTVDGCGTVCGLLAACQLTTSLPSGVFTSTGPMAPFVGRRMRAFGGAAWAPGLACGAVVAGEAAGAAVAAAGAMNVPSSSAATQHSTLSLVLMFDLSTALDRYVMTKGRRDVRASWRPTNLPSTVVHSDDQNSSFLDGRWTICQPYVAWATLHCPFVSTERLDARRLARSFVTRSDLYHSIL
jgi:hypothetical protein